MPSAEEDLVARARRGDSAAFDALLAVHLVSLRAYVRLHLPAALRERESCSDVVQSVCREVLQGQDGFVYRGSEAFRGWLYTWAAHKIQDHLRYWQAEKRAAPARDDERVEALAAVYRSVATPSREAIRKEEILLLEQACEQLAPEQREVIALCRIAGLSREEAGKRMGGRSAGAIRSLLNRALVSLSTELERLGVRE
jgi:RNA polymerase sigma factor (sigma-70 family)